MWSFVTGFFHLATVFQVHPWYIFTAEDSIIGIYHILCISWLFSTLWLLCMKLLSSSRSRIAAGYMVTLCVTFWGTFRLFSKVAVPVYIPSSHGWWFQFLCILTNTCGYLTFIFQPPWRGEMVYHCAFGSSLVRNDAEHLFMYLLATYVCCLEKCLFKSFAHFLTGRCLFIVEHIFPWLWKDSDILFASGCFPAYPGPVVYFPQSPIMRAVGSYNRQSHRISLIELV